MTTDSGKSGGFDAGGDFSKPDDMLAALATGDQPAAAPAPVESTEAPEDDSEVPTWADGETADTPKPQTQSPAAPVLEVKGAKGVQKYTLDPNDAQLKRALEMAGGFRPMQAERDKARQEAQALKSESAALKEKTAVWDELQSLAQAGHTDRVVRAVLGDQAYAAYKKGLADELSASPAQREALERTKAERDREYERSQSDKRIKTLEESVAAREDKLEKDNLRGIGQQALAKFSFRNAVQDADVAEQLDQELWTSALTKLEQLADEAEKNKVPFEATPQLINQVFAQKAKILRGGVTQAANAKVQTIVDSKKSAAKKQAQVAATARYPSSAPAPKVEGWDGKSMSDLIRRMAKG